ncbi:MAG: response regulator [Nostoc sp. DedVER02]|uniref:hybrid sensor histidine kinase/response regulator n=1 Tax=unclassified Nostoc TaxID=2593658 RepID=UPI002AD44BE5|nr:MULTISPECIES: response regulator [unclassified Nostoc]MDZ7985454.1 response regulator [Nostoc sp. DedVER02]MDZ8116920.1 response regulator [Nostoc sp. DedVER01b]
MNTILIIEDEPQVRENIQEILELSDFDTLIAPNGQVGLEIAQKKLPDLIICDIMMPELDGFSVLSALRQNQATINIPLIFVTAKAERSDFRQGMDFGADDYLTKPFSPEELLRAIASRLEKHALVERQTQAKLDELRMNIAHSLPHELNTPLNGILGMSQFLIENCEIMPTSEEVEIAELIYKSANRLNTLVQRFLLYSNLELIAKNPEKARQIKEEGDRCFAKTIISEVAVKKSTANYRQKDLKLYIQESTIQLPEKKLITLVEELLDNSLKFSSSGNEIKIMSKVEGDRFNLYIIDHGKGMTIEEINKVGAFVQFNRKLWEQQGSGLGLAIVQHIVKLYGGEFTIDSIPEKETIVSISLPC